MHLDLQYPIGLLLTTYCAIFAIEGAIRATVIAIWTAKRSWTNGRSCSK